MGVVLKTAAPDPLAGFAAARDAAQAQANAPVAPMYTADEIAQRRQANDDAYRWAMANALMGNENQARVGGRILEQALAGRQERVTDKGVFNPLTGEMKENTQYAQERAQNALKDAASAYNTAAFQHGETESGHQFQAGQNALTRAFEVGQATTAFGRQKELEKMRIDAENERARLAAGAKGANPPSKEEADAAKFGLRMIKAKEAIDQFEKPSTMNENGEIVRHPSGVATTGSNFAASIPFVGNWAENKWMTDEQRQYKAAQDLWLSANLRDESGAAIGKEEAEKDRIKFFPQPNDDPGTIELKRQYREAAEAGMMSNAGRAWQPAVSQYQSMQQANAAKNPPARLNVSREGANAPKPTGPQPMLPRTRAAMAGQPDPFAAPAGINYGPTSY